MDTFLRRTARQHYRRIAVHKFMIALWTCYPVGARIWFIKTSPEFPPFFIM